MKYIKVLFVVIMLTVLPASVFAQIKRHKIPLIDVDYAVTAAQNKAQIPAWKKSLQLIREQYSHVRRSYHTLDGFPFSTQATSLSLQDERTYMTRLLQVQKWVNQNNTLRGFTFTAPVPYDLAHLNEERLEALRFFLSDQVSVKPGNTERVRPFTLAVRLGASNSALEIWIDEPTQKIFLMSDNFYSTAAAKYSLHLK